ncbi:hypothetical protein DF143_35350 [Burkholderia cenocepacia]|nr:hypothetical protein DF143_35350 [Burkholderia cenocepacia]
MDTLPDVTPFAATAGNRGRADRYAIFRATHSRTAAYRIRDALCGPATSRDTRHASLTLVCTGIDTRLVASASIAARTKISESA